MFQIAVALTLALHQPVQASVKLEKGYFHLAPCSKQQGLGYKNSSRNRWFILYVA